MKDMGYLVAFLTDLRTRGYQATPEEVECLCDYVVGCMSDIMDYKQRLAIILKEALGIDKAERDLKALKDALNSQLG